jgi:hypothetical protein
MPVSSGGYEIHIKGRVGVQLLAVFEGMEASERSIETVVLEPSVEAALPERSVETVLRGSVPDQAALHGLLDRIQALGLELIEVRRLSDPPQGQGADPPRGQGADPPRG